jgi:hypothetical protein
VFVKLGWGALFKEKWLAKCEIHCIPSSRIPVWRWLSGMAATHNHQVYIALLVIFGSCTRAVEKGTDNPGHKGFSMLRMTSTTAVVLIRMLCTSEKTGDPVAGLK